MGFFSRLFKLELGIKPVVVAVVGRGSIQQKLLEQAYKNYPLTHLELCCGEEEIEKVLENPAVELVEIFAPLERRFELAKKCLSYKKHISVDMPPAQASEQIRQIQLLAEKNQREVRVRNLLLYYQPYQKARQLLEQEKIGWVLMLRLTIKRAIKIRQDFDPAKWLLDKESGSFALVQYLLGDVEKISAIGSTNDEGAGTILLTMKFKTTHQFGYLLIDFSPQLHIRSTEEKIFRQLWITGTAGVIMVNRAEGQLWRLPALILRAKNYCRTWENLKDNWQDVYFSLAQEAVLVLRKNKKFLSTLKLAEKALILTSYAQKSLKENKEVIIQI